MAARLAHSIDGPEDGVPLLLLHGFPLDRHMWDPVVPALASAGFRIIRPDLPGHGASPPEKAALTMANAARDVVELAQSLRLERFVLGGFSLGGYIALELAAKHRDRLLGLLLVDTRAEGDSDEAKKARAATIAKVESQGMKVLAEAMVPKFLTEATRRERPELVASLTQTILRTPPQGAIHALEGMAQRPDQRENLSQIRLPTLVVVGSEDGLTPPDASRVMSDRIQGSRLVVIPGAAHAVPLERAKEFEKAVLEWARVHLSAWKRGVTSPASTRGR